MSGSNGKALKATFDFSNVSRDWSQQFLKTAQQAARAQNTLERPLRTNATEDQIQAFYDARDLALDTIGLLADQQLELVRQVLKDVPADWLIGGAPDELDWSNAESYQWIQDTHYTEILRMIQSGEARAKAKN